MHKDCLPVLVRSTAPVEITDDLKIGVIPDAFREAANEFFRSRNAEFIVAAQLNTDPEKMPIEDAQAKGPEALSQYESVARLILPAQNRVRRC